MSFSTIHLDRWETPASSYPRRELGIASVVDDHLDIDSYYEAYRQSPPGCSQEYDCFHTQQRLKITNLVVDGEVQMVDDPPHWWAMLDHATHFEGHVLCAGLGLGLIIHTLSVNKKVKSITVIERSQDVIDLIGPLVPKKKRPKFICEDWYNFEPTKEFDGVFFDLFVGDGIDLFPCAVCEAYQLSKRFPNAIRRIHGYGNEVLDRLIANMQ